MYSPPLFPKKKKQRSITTNRTADKPTFTVEFNHKPDKSDYTDGKYKKDNILEYPESDIFVVYSLCTEKIGQI